MANYTQDPLLVTYQPSELRIASEFLNTWLPFLSKGLCERCTQIMVRRVNSLEFAESERAVEETCEYACGNNDISSDQNENRVHDDDICEEDGQSVERASAVPVEAATPEKCISWADMAQQEDVFEEKECKDPNQLSDVNHVKADIVSLKSKPELSREQRERIRFNNVIRKKDFTHMERVGGKVINILDGLELHTGIFSAAEQKRIVEYVYQLEEMGKNGQLRERTYSAPAKWMRGKGRVTIQFGCCYNYARDKDGNPPGIIRNNSLVDPLPHLFKVIIKRLIGWHVLPPTCIPDSCIVNIYEEGDCIPPHIDNHDFVRPFCTVSFLSECKILFGSTLNILGPGEFSGSFAIPLPVGSVLVLNGNGADVAKHCVPAVPTKRISITFRRMNESKRPIGFVPEPDLQDIEPLSYKIVDKPEQQNPPTPQIVPTAQSDSGKIRTNGVRPYSSRGGTHSKPPFSDQNHKSRRVTGRM